MIAEHITPTIKTFAHDRRDTIGASEIGRCARWCWWTKHDPLPDNSRWGNRERGNMIEAWVYERLRAAGLNLDQTQRTRVAGFLSATIDGVIDRTAVEIKSFVGGEYPGRRPLPLHAHLMQVQAQIGLFDLDAGLLLYVNACDLQDLREFPVERDAATFLALRERARRIMSETDPLAFPPEGRIAGGRECRYCQYNNGDRCK